MELRGRAAFRMQVAQRLPTILAPQRSLGRMNARPADVRHPALSLSRFGECYVTLSVAYRNGQSGDSSEHLREPARLEHIYGSGVSRQLDRLAKVAVEKRPSRSHSGFDECLGDDAPFRCHAVSPMSVYLGHSVRKACMGSIDAARRAGTKQAISVMTQSRMATITNVSQSAVPTPYSIPRR